MKKAIFIISVFFLNISIFAQNETGTRYIDKARFQQRHLWLDSSIYVFQTQFPIIRSIPPLNTDMPADITRAYKYLDSLLCIATDKSMDSLLNQWTTLNDSLKISLKYLYKLIDYNPIIFNQYLGEVGLNQKSNPKIANGKYLISPFLLNYDLCEKFRKLYSNTNKLAFYSMFYSNYILRVRILSIDSLRNKNSPLHYMSFNANVQILDTLKGKVFPPQQNIPPPSPATSVILPNNFSFQYTSISYNSLGMINQEQLYFKTDSVFSKKNGFRMKTGQEAIIFITFKNPKYDFQYDYFDLGLNQRCSLNALRIENGNVYDVNHVWSNQTVITYTQWKQIYQNYLQQIMNMSY
jgi:hypothetical protein